MSELDNLLNELRNMKQKQPKFNTKEIWDGIGEKKEWNELGFQSKEEFQKFLLDNPYGNL